MQIILHSDDINLQVYWQGVLNSECKLIDDFEELFTISDALIIINYTAFNEDHKQSIKKLKALGNKLLVLHRVPDIQSAKLILSYGADGYGNALMKGHFILGAIETIKEGMIWLHPEFISELISQIPQNSSNNNKELLTPLSQREKEVVLLLKEGYTYKEIAQKLSITSRTVKAHASKSYEKLHVKDRLALALLLK